MTEFVRMKNLFLKNLFVGLLFCVSLFFSFLAKANATEKKTHFCFFELGNTTASRNFRGKVDKKTPKKKGCPRKKELDGNIVTHCYQVNRAEGDKNSTQAFERMINTMMKEGEKCDTITFSGHHTGNWYGQTGKLHLKDLEKLSCDPKYRDWFNNIKALWLDGCNTVTDNFIQPSRPIKTADSESARVLGNEIKKAEEKNKEYHIRESKVRNLQQAYAGSLDENTPLSSRYLRMAPNAQIFGFNGSAPLWDKDPRKDQVGKQSFMYDHIVNLGKALRGESEWNKIEGDFDRGLKALFSDYCDPKKLEAWEEVSEQAEFSAVENQDYKKAFKLGCDLILAKQAMDNPDSKSAQQALAKHIKKDPNNKDKVLSLANEILNNPDSKENSKKAIQLAKLSLVKTLKAINEEDQNVKENDKTYTHLLFNNIYDTWKTAQKYKTKDTKFFNQVKIEFQNPNFSRSLKQRIKSPYTASLRKGNFIKFWTETQDDKKIQDEEIQKELDKLVEKAKANFPDLKSPKNPNLDDRAKRALSVSVVDQLFQYGLLSPAQIKELAQNKTLFPEGTTNSFFIDTQTKLEFFGRENQIASGTQKGEKPQNEIAQAIQNAEDPTKKNSMIRVGMSHYLKKERISELRAIAEKVDRSETGGAEVYSFFQALHPHLSGKTNDEKVTVLYQLGQNSQGALKELLYRYVASNLEYVDKQKFYKKMRENN